MWEHPPHGRCAGRLGRDRRSYAQELVSKNALSECGKLRSFSPVDLLIKKFMKRPNVSTARLKRDH